MERTVEECALLNALARGATLTRGAQGWRMADALVPAALVGKLARDELVDSRGARAKLTETGHAWAERARDPDAPNRVLGTKGRAGKTTLTENLGENPLAWLLRREKITARQYAAGERMRGDYLLGQSAPSITMRWDAMPSGGGGRGGMEPSEAMIAARRRLAAAKAAAGPGLADILVRVACEGQGLEVAERSFGWPARAGKVVLGLALDRVAGFYGV